MIRRLWSVAVGGDALCCSRVRQGRRTGPTFVGQTRPQNQMRLITLRRSVWPSLN